MLRAHRRRWWLQMVAAAVLLALVAAATSLNMRSSPQAAGAGYIGLTMLAALTAWAAVQRRRWIAEVEAREFLFEEEVLSRFFPVAGPDGKRVLRAWLEAAALAEIPQGRMRLDDRLADICGAPAWYYRLALAPGEIRGLRALIEEEVLNGADRPDRLDTVSDLVSFLLACPRYADILPARPAPDQHLSST